jgi:hypothetical protein
VADLGSLSHAAAGAPDPTLELRDLTPDAGTHLIHGEADLAHEGPSW